MDQMKLSQAHPLSSLLRSTNYLTLFFPLSKNSSQPWLYILGTFENPNVQATLQINEF